MKSQLFYKSASLNHYKKHHHYKNHQQPSNMNAKKEKQQESNWCGLYTEDTESIKRDNSKDTVRVIISPQFKECKQRKKLVCWKKSVLYKFH